MTLLRHPANWWRDNRVALLAGITALLTLLLTVGGAVGIANAATKPASVEGKTFTIATDTTWAPFEFQRDGELRGIDIDLIHAVAEDQGFDVKISYSRPHGVGAPRSTDGGDPFGPEQLLAVVPDIAERDVFVCGPPSLLSAAASGLRKAGVPNHHIHLERFDY